MVCVISEGNRGRVRNDAEIFPPAAMQRHCVVISQNKTAGPRTHIRRVEEKGRK